MFDQFLTEIYTFMLKNHARATKRRFPRINYGIRKKSRYGSYPQTLKSYFSNLIKRLRRTKDGKYLFAGIDNLAFWAPSLSNNCKIHGNNCPIYCRHNSHNDIILKQNMKSGKMLHDKESDMYEEERLNLWKRKDLADERKKIFLCLDEAEHCTFEPKINKNENARQLNNDELINKRISNKAWVEEMGENFSTKFPLVYKEGVLRKAKSSFNDGKFTEVIKILEVAFDLDVIKAYFDPKYAEIYYKKMEDEHLKQAANQDRYMGHEKPKNIVSDKFSNPKNKRICEEVYYMLKDMEDYKKDKNKQIKKLEQELTLIKREKNRSNSRVKESLDKNTQLKISFIKDRYFKFFKSIMCPLKEQCQYDQRPKWPHTYVKSYSPFGLSCPYAHHVSELKFVNEVKAKIRMKEKLIETLKKDTDPIIKDWVHPSPLVSCLGCGKAAVGKDKRARVYFILIIGWLWFL